MTKKLTWMNMPMGALKKSLVFGAIMSALQQECHSEVEKHNIRDCGLEAIMDGIMLLKILLFIILQYYEGVI